MEEKLLVILAFCITNILAFFMLRITNGRHTQFLSPVALFYIVFLAFVHIGSVALVLDGDLLLHVLVPNDLQERLVVHSIQMSIGILFFFLGACICSLILKFSATSEIPNFQRLPSLPPSDPALMFTLIAGGFLAASLITLLYMMNLEFVPLWTATVNLLSGQSSDLSAMRQELTGDTNIPGVVVQMMRTIIPTLWLLLWFVWRRHFNRPQLGILIVVFGLLTVFVLFSLGQRSPVIEFMITALVVSQYYRPTPRRAVLRFAKIGAVIFVVTLVMTTLLERSGEASSIEELISINVDELMYRIFITHAQTGSYLYQLFPYSMEFKGWDIYIENFSGYLPGHSESFSRDLFSYIHSWKGSASHSSFAEGYASFGTLGVLSIAFILGWINQLATIRLVRGAKSDARLAFYGFISLALTGPAIGSVAGILYNGLAASLALYACISGAKVLLHIRDLRVTSKPLSV